MYISEKFWELFAELNSARDQIDQDVISSYIGSSCSYQNNVPAALAERVLPYRPAFFFFLPGPALFRSFVRHYTQNRITYV